MDSSRNTVHSVYKLNNWGGRGCILSRRSPLGTAWCPVSEERRGYLGCTYLVDPASSHMLVSKIKPCMSKYILSESETANGSLNQS